MEKIILALGLIALILISGCTEETPVRGRGTSSEESQLPTELNLQIGETANTSEVEVTVLSAQVTDSYEYTNWRDELDLEMAPQGKKFLLAEARIKNVGRDSTYVAAGDFSTTDSEGNAYDRKWVLGDDDFPSLKELYKGQKTEGYILFEVPEDATDLKILYDFGSIFTETKLASWQVS